MVSFGAFVRFGEDAFLLALVIGSLVCRSTRSSRQDLNFNVEENK